MDLPVEEQVVAEDLDESESSSGSSSTRGRKRFLGAQSTWRHFTYEEQLVSTSLTRLRDQDLSVHLYNAHAMKSCQNVPDAAGERKPDSWAAKHMWGGEEGIETNDIQEYFVPPKTWTAWPLPANLVPRAGEQIGPVDPDDAFTFKRQELDKPSRELEDILTGVTLRIAKEKFEGREWNSPALQPSVKPVTPPSRSFSQVDQALLDVPLPEDELFLVKISEPLLDKSAEVQHPVISADDDRSRELLKPTVQHILSQLDELLMALHHTRQTCLQYGSERYRSGTEGNGERSSAEETENDSRLQTAQSTSETQLLPKRGRPRKVLNIPDSTSGHIETAEVTNLSKRGRPKKVRMPLLGETYNEMLVRIARSQNQKLPFQSASNSRASSAAAKPPRRLKRSSSEKDPGQNQLARLGLRDWSEIIGTAALVGFSPDIVSRAGQRCANIFGEGMKMHSLEENQVSEEGGDETFSYLPEMIPDFDEDNVSESDAGSATVRQKARPLRRRAFRSQSVKDVEGLEELKPEEHYWCSFRECPRHDEGFSKKSNLFSHLKNAHKLKGDELGNALKDGNEEMVGAVHVDGFLREIKTRKGWGSHSSGSRARSTSQDQRIEEDI